MDNQDTIRFMRDEVCLLWPKWNPSEAESRIWCDALSPLEYEQAVYRVRQYYAGRGSGRVSPNIRDALVKPADSDRPKAPPPLYGYVLCLSAPEAHPAWEGRRWPVNVPFSVFRDKSSFADYLKGRSAAIQDREGSRWCGVIAEALEDDGLRGEAARQEAERRILDGPDCIARRYLVTIGRAAMTTKSATKQKEELIATIGVFRND